MLRGAIHDHDGAPVTGTGCRWRLSRQKWRWNHLSEYSGGKISWAKAQAVNLLAGDASFCAAAWRGRRGCNGLIFFCQGSQNSAGFVPPRAGCWL